MIRRTASKSRWVAIPVAALEDQRLSWKARGLLAYILAKPDNWEIRVQQLKHASDKDGRCALQAALQELKVCGYAKIEMYRDDETGRTEGNRWDVADAPIYRQTENLSDGKPTRRKTRLLSIDPEETLDPEDTLEEKEPSPPIAEDQPSQPKPKHCTNKTALPKTFVITDEMRTWAMAQTGGVATLPLDDATEQWKDAMQAGNFKYVDWVAAWRNGMRNAAKWATQQQRDYQAQTKQKSRKARELWLARKQEETNHDPARI